jgi:hypothetical protein
MLTDIFSPQRTRGNRVYAESNLQTANYPLPTAKRQLPTANCKLLTAKLNYSLVSLFLFILNKKYA